jgi:hypothetical protein
LILESTQVKQMMTVMMMMMVMVMIDPWPGRSELPAMPWLLLP